MYTATCKCGKTSMTFKHLTAESFGSGWETDCCIEAKKEKRVEPEVKEAAPIEKGEKAPETPKTTKKKRRRSRKKSGSPEKSMTEKKKEDV